MEQEIDFKQIRTDLGKTQFEVAVAARLSLPTVQRFECGKATGLLPRTIKRLADGYGVSVDVVRRAVTDAHPSPSGPVQDIRAGAIANVT